VDETRTTGLGFIRQTDWSGGAGQTDFADPSRFDSSNGYVEVSNPTGELRLSEVFGEYYPPGILESSSFDVGTSANFHQILWLPQGQPPDTGSDPVRFQVATNNDNATWNFVGPDGTAATTFTLADQNIGTSHNGDRYFRYKVQLDTASTSWTPSVSDVSFTYTSDCVPPGQVLFSGLAEGTYTVSVSRAGYQSYSDTLSITAPWQHFDVVLTP
jgi:hypothetical protein